MPSDDVEVDVEVEVEVDRDELEVELGDVETAEAEVERDGLEIEVEVEVEKRGGAAESDGSDDAEETEESEHGGDSGESGTDDESGADDESRTDEPVEMTVEDESEGDAEPPETADATTVDEKAAHETESAVERDRSSGGGQTSERPLDEDETPPGSDAFEEKDRSEVVEDPTAGVGSGDAGEHGAGADVDLSSTGGTEPGTAEDDPGPELDYGAEDRSEAADLGSVPTNEDASADVDDEDAAGEEDVRDDADEDADEVDDEETDDEDDGDSPPGGAGAV